MLRTCLERWPLATCAAAFLVVTALAFALVLPRLDGLEISGTSVRPDPADASRVALEVRLRYRLASAMGGTILVRVPSESAGERPAEERIEIARGSGEAHAVLHLPRREAAAIVAEIEASGTGVPLLDRLLAGRRRDARVARLDPP